MPHQDHYSPEPTGPDDDGIGHHDIPTTDHADGRHDPDRPSWEHLEIVDGGDLADAIASSLGGLGHDDLSSGEAQRVARLQFLLDNPWKRKKRRLRGSQEMIERLAVLSADCPNFAAVTELVIRAAQLSATTQTAMKLPPMLLLGDPGIGKSHYSRELAAVLGSEVTAIAGTTMADASSLTGLNSSWRGARSGRIATALIEGRTCNPIVVVDEIDKIAGYGSDRPLDAMLGLLEPGDASSFMDDYLGVPMRADGIIWLCTANEVAPLSAPLRDRLLTVRVPPLSALQRDAIAQKIFGDLNATYTGRFALASDALVPARGLTTRRLKAVLTASLGYAVAASRWTVIDADIAAALTLVVSDTPQARIGFDFGHRQS